MSRKVSFRERDVSGPPEGSAWVWYTYELLRSDSWRGRSINLRRLLDYLEMEHLRHDRRENGRLMALYGDLVKEGIGRRLIMPAILEGEERGLIVVDHGLCMANGKHEPSRYRLTYFPTCTTDPKTKATIWSAPTDEWRRYKAASRKNHFELAKGELGRVHEGEPAHAENIQKRAFASARR